MFCTNCGGKVPDAANFCVGCGSPVHRAPSTSPIQDPPAPSTYLSQPSVKSTKCKWCGAVVDASQLNCAKCGATISLEGVIDRAGWGQLPGRKDMAKLQFGNSFCQIEGAYV